MRNFIWLISFFYGLSGNSQSLDTLVYMSLDSRDSLISFYEQNQVDCNDINTIDTWKDYYDFRLRDGRLDIVLIKDGYDVRYNIHDNENSESFEALYRDGEVIIQDDDKDDCTALQRQIDSLQNLVNTYQLLLESRKSSVIADTFNFELIDDRIKVEVNKKGHDVWINVIDDSVRINADYINYRRLIRLMNGSDQVGNLFVK